MRTKKEIMKKTQTKICCVLSSFSILLKIENYGAPLGNQNNWPFANERRLKNNKQDKI